MTEMLDLFSDRNFAFLFPVRVKEISQINHIKRLIMSLINIYVSFQFSCFPSFLKRVCSSTRSRFAADRRTNTDLRIDPIAGQNVCRDPYKSASVRSRRRPPRSRALSCKYGIDTRLSRPWKIDLPRRCRATRLIKSSRSQKCTPGRPWSATNGQIRKYFIYMSNRRSPASSFTDKFSRRTEDRMPGQCGDEPGQMDVIRIGDS